MELVACCPLGLVELPVGWELARGDLLARDDGRLVPVVEHAPLTVPPSLIAALHNASQRLGVVTGATR